MHPSESHAWFRAASPATLCSIHRQGAAAHDYWRYALLCDYREHQDIAVHALGPFDPVRAITAATRAQIELALIVHIFPEEPRHVLRPSWE
jgi:hypothetical protein